MDYVIGSVAALVSGNVTPNRPKILKRPLTPTKHQSSPNVTPKSELVDDRSIFMSPTLQKKKAIVKKSPKRIFQNSDLETTENCDTTTPSPKADKVKKHLKKELDNSPVKSPKVNLSESSSKLNKASETNDCEHLNDTPKKKKKKCKSKADNENDESIETASEPQEESESPKKKKHQSLIQSNTPEVNNELEEQENKESDNETTEITVVKKNKKRKKKVKSQTNLETNDDKENDINETVETDTDTITKKKKKKQIVNPNAITTQDSDSEHDSDDEIKCENEEINKKILTTKEDSSSEEEEEPEKKVEKVETPTISSIEEVKRTLFVGNVPYSKKCKKDIKKIFGKHGQIETIRIRTVPVKDGRYTPKMALVKNELHPDRSTVNVYIKYKDTQSVNDALVENNTVLNDHHLRVSRSDTTGAEHDPRLSVFIGNLPFAIEDEVLRSKFEKCGEIESVRIIRDKKTNAGKGFGYINFNTKDGVELALKMSEEDLTIKNRILRVKRCTQQAQKGVKINRGKPSKFYPQSNDTRSFGNRQMGNRQDRPGQGNRQDRPGQGNRQRAPGQGNQQEGAYRRVMNKRKSQETNEGPPNKRQNVNQPIREKKTRKEFVGVTAEKKKKRKFDKGQKKKKVLSEILTK